MVCVLFAADAFAHIGRSSAVGVGIHTMSRGTCTMPTVQVSILTLMSTNDAPHASDRVDTCVQSEPLDSLLV